MANRSRSQRVTLSDAERQRIIDLLDKRGWTLAEAAEAAGFSARSMDKISAASEPVNRDHIELLAKALGMSVKKMLGEMEVEFSQGDMPPDLWERLQEYARPWIGERKVKTIVFRAASYSLIILSCYSTTLAYFYYLGYLKSLMVGSLSAGSAVSAIYLDGKTRDWHFAPSTWLFLGVGIINIALGCYSIFSHTVISIK